MKNWIFAVVCLSIFSACKDKNEPIVEQPVTVPSSEIHLIPQFNGENIALDEVFTSDEGYDIKISNFQILGTSLGHGTNEFASAFLFNWPSGSTRMSMVSSDYTSYDSIRFNIGVPETINHADPTLPSSNSPLNISNAAGMHWGWNPGYIFVKVEGKIDTLNDGVANFDKSFSFHLGGDSLFRLTPTYKLSWMESSSKQFTSNLYFDFSLFFDEPNDPLNIKIDSYTHSSPAQEELNKRLMGKVVRAIHE